MSVAFAELIEDINFEFFSDIKEYTEDEQLGLKRKTNWDLIKLIYLSAYVNILEYYNRDTITGDDDNFFTTAEIWDIIQHVNGITGKDFYIDLS